MSRVIIKEKIHNINNDNDNEYLQNIFYILDTLPNILHVYSQLILTTAASGRYYIFPILHRRKLRHGNKCLRAWKAGGDRGPEKNKVPCNRDDDPCV